MAELALKFNWNPWSMIKGNFPHRFFRAGTVLVAPVILAAFAFSAEAVRIGSVKGRVEVRRSQAQVTRWNALKKGQSLKPGDTVRTGQGGKVELKLDDGSKVVVGPSSRVKVQESSPNKLFYLAVGKMKSFVKKLRPSNAFEVRTPVAAAAVRGTVFEMGFDEEGKAGYLEVDRGTVLLTQDGREQAVESGQRMDFVKDIPLGEAVGRALPANPAETAVPNERSALAREVGLGMSKEMVMAAAASEIRRAEYQEGKTLLDVNGNRVRLEEYIIRNPSDAFAAANPDRAFKLVALNERDDRFDYFYYLGVFNQTLPDDLSIAFNDVRGRLNVQPTYYLEQYEMGLSNTRDAIRDVSTGGHIVQVDYDGTNYTLTDPNDPLSHSRTILADDEFTSGGEVFHKIYDPMGDRFVTLTEEQFQASGGVPSVYDGESDNFRSLTAGDNYFRPAFNHYEHWVLGEGLSPATPKQSYDWDPGTGATTVLALDYDAAFTYPVDPLNPTDDTVIVVNESPSGEDVLHRRVTLLYRDGTFETADTYILSNEGEIAPTDAFSGLTDGPGFKNELLNWNYQQVISASEFSGRKIDLVIEPKILLKSGLIQ